MNNWKDIKHKSTEEQRDQAVKDLNKEYDKLKWKVARLYDRLSSTLRRL